MFTTLARIILRNRITMLVLLFAATVFMLFQGQSVNLSYKFSRLLPLTDSTQVNYDLFRAEFNQVGNTVVIAADNLDVFDKEVYQQWQSFEENLDTIFGVKNVLSPISAANLVRNDSTGKLEIVSFKKAYNAENSEDLGKLYRGLPFYQEMLYSKDGRSPLMLVKLEDEHLYTKNIIRIIESVKKVVSHFEESSGHKMHVSGLPYIRMANTKKVSKQIGQSVGLAMLITSLLMFFFLRSVKATIISMLVVGIGVIWSFGLISTFNFTLSMLSALIPSLIIVIGVPNCIFLINKYHAEYKHHQNKILGVQRVIRKIGAATLLTNTTTALGFAAFIFTDSVVLREFGIIASLNILLVFVVSIIIIPIFYSYSRTPKKRHYLHLEKNWLEGFINFLTRTIQEKRPTVYSIAILLALVGVYGATRIVTTGNITEEYKEDDPLLKDLRFLERNYGGVVPLEIVIDTQRKNGAQKLSTIKRLAKLQQSLSEIPGLSRSLSVADGIKFAKQAYYRGDSSFYDIPNSQEKNFILSAIPRQNDGLDLLNSMIDTSGQKVRVSIQARDLVTAESTALQARVRQAVYHHFDPEQYNITITGASVVFVHGTSYLIKNLFVSLALAICVIALIMALLFRSFTMVLISLLPNILPLLLTAGIMGYFGVPLKPSTILVFSIAFGISVDDTIHFLAKYRQELRANGWRIAEAVLAATRETGVSMLYTSIVLFFGFSTFLSSGFGGIVALGILVSVTLIIAMLSNLILLPSLLMSLARRAATKEFNEPLITIYKPEQENEDEFTEEAEKETEKDLIKPKS